MTGTDTCAGASSNAATLADTGDDDGGDDTGVECPVLAPPDVEIATAGRAGVAVTATARGCTGMTSAGDSADAGAS